MDAKEQVDNQELHDKDESTTEEYIIDEVQENNIALGDVADLDQDFYSEDDDEESETLEEAETTEEETPKEEIKTQPPVAQQTKQEGADSDFVSFAKDKINLDIVPGSKEFIKTTAAEAKKQVESALKGDGQEFDEFNPEHQSMMNYYLVVEQQKRTRDFNDRIGELRGAYEENERKNAFQSVINKTAPIVDGILSTPELQKAMTEAMDNLSVKTHREVMQALANGDASLLIDIAKKVAGVKDGTYPARNKVEKTSGNKQSQAKTGYASELIL